MGAWAAVATVDPNEPGHYPTCPFLALTDLYCPACGGLRAAHALARGDVGTAAGRNVLFVAAVPLLLVLWARWVRVSAVGDRRLQPPSSRAWAVAGVVALAFAVLRNLPSGAWLAP
jgi:hypothetical protein